MTDLELLELAASAAGLKTICGDMLQGLWVEGRDCEWNPLQDNDEAMWLLVTLRLSLESDAHILTDEYDGYGEYEPGVEVWLVTAGGKLLKSWELYGKDPQAATRRAVVGCAAKIGKEIKHD